ncbi:MAG: nickel-dependent lactate racemase [Bacteroidales bacterium]|jgi:nickel-dependent lactate racemase|nr:nickel-dependent lactate racemase [Bacteroidales bacterium]
MDYKLSYGKTRISIPLQGQEEFIRVNPPGDSPDKKVFMDELSSCIKQSPSTAGIIVSDKTRICEYDKFLPWLTEALNNKGIGNNSICFYIAYGTHPVQSEEESLRIYGDTYNKFGFVHHDCDDAAVMISLGTTKRGTDVKIRKDIFSHDLLILFGSLSHHYFAGYGGGRKLLFPGLADRQSIYANHKLFIDFENAMLHPGCLSGRLKGNPVAEDLFEIDTLMPDKIIISGIPGSDGKISRLMTGNTYDDFLSACMHYDRYFRKESKSSYDNVIASAGGYPKDINFIQSHKSLHNAASFVRDKGNLILLAECNDGIGNDEFFRIFKDGTKKDILDKLKTHYTGNGGTALSLLSKTERINVHMISSLSREICNTLNINKLCPNELQSAAGRFKGKTAVIENASMLYC